MFIVNLTDPCINRLKCFDKEIQRRFFSKIEKLRTNPDSFGKPLRGELHGYWELYLEKRFRILYTIDIRNKQVTIEAIRHKDEF